MWLVGAQQLGLKEKPLTTANLPCHFRGCNLLRAKENNTGFRFLAARRQEIIRLFPKCFLLHLGQPYPTIPSLLATRLCALCGKSIAAHVVLQLGTLQH